MDAELGIYKRQGLLTRLHSIRKRIYTGVADLDTSICTAKEPIPFDQRSTYQSRKITNNQTWGKAFTCAWFHLKGQIPEQVKSQHIVLIVTIDGEGLYVNDSNEPISAITSRLSFVDHLQSTKGKTVIEYTKYAEGGEKIDLWLEGWFNGKLVLPFGKSRFRKAFIAVCRDDIKRFYYDYLTLSYALDATEDGTKQKEINTALNLAYSALKNYAIEDIKNASTILNTVLSKQNTSEQITFTAIGHSHLDLAWLWPIRETKRKAVRTFTNALNNIEKYPEYIYGASQPQQFEWIKLSHPSLFARLKEAVKEGRIELQGGMWTEPDTNLTSGESLIRQSI